MAAPRLFLASFCLLVACSDPPSSTTDAGVPPDLADDPAPPPSGTTLNLRVLNGDDLSPMPARAIITAVPPTKQPDFHRDGATALIMTPDALAISDGALLVTGEAQLPMPPGTYDVTLLQGPEYEKVSRRVTLAKDSSVSIDVVLEHSVHTPGWLAADMHIHSSRSFDSRLLPAHRVISEVAAGIEVLVPTDHVFHQQLQPYIDALSYSDRAVSIAGSEYGFKSGHLGVYPVEFDASGALWGAPQWELYENWQNLTDMLVFPMIHALPQQPLVVVNHPRLLPDLGYFTNIGWPTSPDQPLATADMFDGLEVLNGYQSAPSDVTPLLRDWFFLLSGGHRITGLGNSDTHRMDWLTSGYPRTWLKLGTDVPSRVLPSDLRTAIVNMRAVASTGPYLTLQVDGHDIGDTILPRSPTVIVDVTVDAPSWIDLSRVIIYRNGEMVRDFALGGPGPRSHPALHQQMSLPINGDAWILAVAVGNQPLPTSIIGAVRNGATLPFALTNPIWIDADGDGKVTPPPFSSSMAPQPFDRAVGFFDAFAPPRRETNLHAPLDCEPDAYLEWLERTPGAK